MANGQFVQQADPYVSGAFQSFLSILQVPITGLVAQYWPDVKTKLTFSRIVGSTIVIGGVLTAVIPELLKPPAGSHPSGWNSPFWMIMFVLSLFPGVISSVWSEQLFDRGVEPFSALLWSTFYSIPLYLLYLPIQGIFIGQDAVWNNQHLALKCFFNYPNIPGCLPNAWVIVIMFVVCYGILSYLLLLLIRHESALFQAIVATLSTPLSAIAFSFKWLLGPYSEPFGVFSILAAVIIPIGVIVYKFDAIRQDIRQVSKYDPTIAESPIRMLVSPMFRRRNTAYNTPLLYDGDASSEQNGRPSSVPPGFFETPSSRWL